MQNLSPVVRSHLPLHHDSGEDAADAPHPPHAKALLMTPSPINLYNRAPHIA
jgi:hypothetical protein